MPKYTIEQINEYSLISKHAYERGATTAPPGWTIFKTYSGDDYNGIAYRNDTSGEIIIGHGGTDLGQFGHYIRLAELAFSKLPSAHLKAERFYAQVKDELKKRGYGDDNTPIMHVGHSAGGSHSQLFCVEYSHDHACTFDSPGIIELLINNDKPWMNDVAAEFQKHLHDLQSYPCANYIGYEPNFVNTHGTRIGITTRLPTNQVLDQRRQAYITSISSLGLINVNPLAPAANMAAQYLYWNSVTSHQLDVAIQPSIDEALRQGLTYFEHEAPQSVNQVGQKLIANIQASNFLSAMQLQPETSQKLEQLVTVFVRIPSLKRADATSTDDIIIERAFQLQDSPASHDEWQIWSQQQAKRQVDNFISAKSPYEAMEMLQGWCHSTPSSTNDYFRSQQLIAGLISDSQTDPTLALVVRKLKDRDPFFSLFFAEPIVDETTLSNAVPPHMVKPLMQLYTTNTTQASARNIVLQQSVAKLQQGNLRVLDDLQQTFAAASTDTTSTKDALSSIFETVDNTADYLKWGVKISAGIMRVFGKPKLANDWQVTATAGIAIGAVISKAAFAAMKGAAASISVPTLIWTIGSELSVIAQHYMSGPTQDEIIFRELQLIRKAIHDIYNQLSDLKLNINKNHLEMLGKLSEIANELQSFKRQTLQKLDEILVVVSNFRDTYVENEYQKTTNQLVTTNTKMQLLLAEPTATNTTVKYDEYLTEIYVHATRSTLTPALSGYSKRSLGKEALYDQLQAHSQLDMIFGLLPQVIIKLDEKIEELPLVVPNFLEWRKAALAFLQARQAFPEYNTRKHTEMLSEILQLGLTINQIFHIMNANGWFIDQIQKRLDEQLVEINDQVARFVYDIPVLKQHGTEGTFLGYQMPEMTMIGKRTASTAVFPDLPSQLFDIDGCDVDPNANKFHYFFRDTTINTHVYGLPMTSYDPIELAERIGLLRIKRDAFSSSVIDGQHINNGFLLTHSGFAGHRSKQNPNFNSTKIKVERQQVTLTFSNPFNTEYTFYEYRSIILDSSGNNRELPRILEFYTSPIDDFVKRIVANFNSMNWSKRPLYSLFPELTGYSSNNDARYQKDGNTYYLRLIEILVYMISAYINEQKWLYLQSAIARSTFELQLKPLISRVYGLNCVAIFQKMNMLQLMDGVTSEEHLARMLDINQLDVNLYEIFMTAFARSYRQEQVTATGDTNGQGPILIRSLVPYTDQFEQKWSTDVTETLQQFIMINSGDLKTSNRLPLITQVQDALVNFAEYHDLPLTAFHSLNRTERQYQYTAHDIQILLSDWANQQGVLFYRFVTVTMATDDVTTLTVNINKQLEKSLTDNFNLAKRLETSFVLVINFSDQRYGAIYWEKSADASKGNLYFIGFYPGKISALTIKLAKDVQLQPEENVTFFDAALTASDNQTGPKLLYMIDGVVKRGKNFTGLPLTFNPYRQREKALASLRAYHEQQQAELVDEFFLALDGYSSEPSNVNAVIIEYRNKHRGTLVRGHFWDSQVQDISTFTATQLYQYITNAMLQRYMVDNDSQQQHVAHSLEKPSPALLVLPSFIKTLAWNTLLNDLVYFDNSNCQQLMGDNKEYTELLEKLVAIGYLRVHLNENKGVAYYFSHPTMQYYLAAQHMAQMWLTDPQQAKELTIKHKHFRWVWSFVAGLLAQMGGDDYLQAFFDALLTVTQQDVLGVSHHMMLMRCLDESNLCEIVQKPAIIKAAAGWFNILLLQNEDYPDDLRTAFELSINIVCHQLFQDMLIVKLTSLPDIASKSGFFLIRFCSNLLRPRQQIIAILDTLIDTTNANIVDYQHRDGKLALAAIMALCHQGQWDVVLPKILFIWRQSPTYSLEQQYVYTVLLLLEVKALRNFNQVNINDLVDALLIIIESHNAISDISKPIFLNLGLTNELLHYFLARHIKLKSTNVTRIIDILPTFVASPLAPVMIEQLVTQLLENINDDGNIDAYCQSLISLLKANTNYAINKGDYLLNELLTTLNKKDDAGKRSIFSCVSTLVVLHLPLITLDFLKKIEGFYDAGSDLVKIGVGRLITNLCVHGSESLSRTVIEQLKILLAKMSMDTNQEIKDLAGVSAVIFEQDPQKSADELKRLFFSTSDVYVKKVIVERLFDVVRSAPQLLQYLISLLFFPTVYSDNLGTQFKRFVFENQQLIVTAITNIYQVIDVVASLTGEVRDSWLKNLRSTVKSLIGSYPHPNSDLGNFLMARLLKDRDNPSLFSMEIVEAFFYNTRFLLANLAVETKSGRQYGSAKFTEIALNDLLKFQGFQDLRSRIIAILSHLVNLCTPALLGSDSEITFDEFVLCTINRHFPLYVNSEGFSMQSSALDSPPKNKAIPSNIIAVLQRLTLFLDGYDIVNATILPSKTTILLPGRQAQTQAQDKQQTQHEPKSAAAPTDKSASCEGLTKLFSAHAQDIQQKVSALQAAVTDLPQQLQTMINSILIGQQQILMQELTAIRDAIQQQQQQSAASSLNSEQLSHMIAEQMAPFLDEFRKLVESLPDILSSNKASSVSNLVVANEIYRTKQIKIDFKDLNVDKLVDVFTKYPHLKTLIIVKPASHEVTTAVDQDLVLDLSCRKILQKGIDVEMRLFKSPPEAAITFGYYYSNGKSLRTIPDLKHESKLQNMLSQLMSLICNEEFKILGFSDSIILQDSNNACEIFYTLVKALATSPFVPLANDELLQQYKGLRKK